MLPLTVPVTPSYQYPFPPPPTAKRANTLLIKHKLVELLPPEQGEVYWSLLCNLITGKITREEFELGWQEHLATSQDAGGLIDGGSGRSQIDHDQLSYLHNALLLSILYNTTKATLPPASVAHTGWTSKRKRGGVDALGEGPGADPLGEYARKRRRLKRLVAGMTKAEKKRLRLLLNNRDRKLPDALANVPPNETIAEKTRLGLMPASAGLKTPNSAALQQEIQRVQAVPTCFDSGELPDLQSMTDRMAGIAYSMALPGGTNPDAAAMISVALDTYLKNILSSLLAVSSADASKESSSGKLKGSKKGKARQLDPKAPNLVTRNNMLSLLELSPSILHSTHIASVEKFVAHQHLYELPSPEERAQMLEMRLEQQINANSASTSKVPLPAPLPSTSTATTLPESSATGAEGLQAKDSDLQVNITAVSPERPAQGDDGMDAEDVKPPQTARPPLMRNLESELFPELPKSAPAILGLDTASIVKATKKAKKFNKGGADGDDSASSGDENEVPPTPAIAERSSDGLLAKDADSKENAANKAKKDISRGRFGLWKLLTGLLEGSTGSQNMQSNLRFQHQSVL